MGKLKTFRKMWSENPDKLKQKFISDFSRLKISHIIPDKMFLKLYYKVIFGRKLNLQNPKTFNEKLQWLKQYDRNPEYTRLVDKYEVKKIVAEKIGEKYVIPALGIWKQFDEINFKDLPNQFVLKCTHDSGGIVICTDKSKLNVEEVRRKLCKCMSRNFYYQTREWPYKNVKPRILAEKYIIDETYGELRDYKFFCFNGEPKIMFVATERQLEGEEVKFDFFDMDYNHLNIINGHPNAKTIPEKPVYFDEMKMLARVLSEGIPHVRIDFYEANGHVYFGEFTFAHFGGFVPFEPEEWDYRLGEWIVLPERK